MAWRPISLGPYRLGDAGLVVERTWEHRTTGELVRSVPRGKAKQYVKHEPTIDEATAAGEFLQGWEKRGPFWTGDWWNDARERWPETHQQLVDATEFDLETLDEYARVARKIPKSRRFVTRGVSFTAHQAVAALDTENQRRILVKAKAENLNVTAVRAEARRVRRGAVAEGAAVLRGKYRVLLCDPDHEEVTIEELAAIPVQAHMLVNSVAFITCPESRRFKIAEVLDAWGFEHRSAFVWDRVLHQGPGAYLDVRHEHVLLCVRGKCSPDNLTPMLDSVVTHRAGPEVGELPEAFRKMIERLYDRGPYLELFAKRKMKRAGWTFYGTQLGKAVA